MGKIIYIFLCIVHFSICVASGIYGRRIQFLVVGFSHVILGVLLLRKNPFVKKIIGKLLIFAPLIVLYTLTSVYMAFYDNFRLLPFLFACILGTVFSLIFYNKTVKGIVLPSAIVLAFFSVASYFLMNYYNALKIHQTFNQTNTKSFVDYNLTITDENGKLVSPFAFKSNISVIDVWSSKCGACIQGFPKYEMLKKQYSTKGVKFYTLNVKEGGDDNKRVRKFTEPYSFSKLYTGVEGFEKLGINTVPCTYILDKNMNVVYVGQIYTGKAMVFNNFHTIISNLNQ